MYWIGPSLTSPPSSLVLQTKENSKLKNHTNNFINTTLETITSFHKNNNNKNKFQECLSFIFTIYKSNTTIYFYAIIPSSRNVSCNNNDNQIILFHYNTQSKEHEILLSTISSLQGKYILEMGIVCNEYDKKNILKEDSMKTDFVSKNDIDECEFN